MDKNMPQSTKYAGWVNSLLVTAPGAPSKRRKSGQREWGVGVGASVLCFALGREVTFPPRWLLFFRAFLHFLRWTCSLLSFQRAMTVSWSEVERWDPKLNLVRATLDSVPGRKTLAYDARRSLLPPPAWFPQWELSSLLLKFPFQGRLVHLYWKALRGFGKSIL